MDTFLYLQWHNACQMASFHKADSVESDKITLTKDGIDSVQEHQNSRVCCGGMHRLCCVEFLSSEHFGPGTFYQVNFF